MLKKKITWFYKKIDNELVLEIKEYCENHTIKEASLRFNISESTVKRYKNKIPNNGRSLNNKSNYVINWRKRTKRKLVDYKGGKCVKCGYKKCIEALEFHHVDPNGKDFSVAGKSLSFERMKKEVDKCILVCANCHKEIHYSIN